MIWCCEDANNLIIRIIFTKKPPCCIVLINLGSSEIEITYVYVNVKTFNRHHPETENITDLTFLDEAWPVNCFTSPSQMYLYDVVGSFMFEVSFRPASQVYHI